MRKKALSLPLKPGVYLMKNLSGEILYVGKAKLLRNRVYSYFHAAGSHTVKVATMVSHVRDFDVIITDTEFEALMLENSLIKHHKPKYNILLKDDKGYPFIRLDEREAFPSFTLSMKPSNDGARYFGPYRGRRMANEVIETLNEMFRLPVCSRKFPRDIGKTRPCLNKHLKKCVCVCDKSIDSVQYHELISQAIMLLEGEISNLMHDLRIKMETAAENLDFEKAAKLRDRIAAVEKLGQRQKVVANRVPDMDIICIYPGTVRSCGVVLHYVEGALLGKDLEIIDTPLEEADIPDVMEEFLKQYYRLQTMIPSHIAVSCEIDEEGIIERWLTSESGHKVTIETPKRGDKKRLIELAMENAREEARLATTSEERIAKILEALGKLAGMNELPLRIEAFDISNTAGGETVGGMIVLKNGKYSRGDYRRFQIKGVSTQDDYASMAEMLTRRFENFLSQDERFNEAPQLVLIDGGVAHATVAFDVLKRLGVSVTVLGMVKDDRHRTRALVTPDGDEIGISATPSVFSFIGNIQEEVHRYAIGYHRKLRQKKVTGSSLDSIAGIGEKRRRALLKRFRTVDAIRNATVEELAEVIPQNAAQAVYDRYHNKTENKI